MVIDATVSIGNLLQILAMLGGGFWFLYSVKGEMSGLTIIQKQFADRLEKIDKQLEILAKTTIELAKQEVRMNNIDARQQEFSNRLDDIGKLTKLLLPPGRARRNRD
jgi:hypothetical protein